MRTNLLKFIFLSLCIPLVISGAAGIALAQEFSISSFISESAVAKGGEVILTVEFYWSGAPDSIDISPPKIPDSYLLELTASSQKNVYKMYSDKNINKIEFEYKFKATEPGMGRISYIALEFTDKQTGVKRVEKTKSYDITVLSAQRYWLRRSAQTAVYVVAGSGIVALILASVFLMKKRKQKKRMEKLILSGVHAGLEQEILAELKSLKKYKVSGDAGKLLDSIINVLNRYFEQRYGISFSKALTGPDTAVSIRSDIPDKTLIEFKDIIALSNRVKFSGEKLSPEDMDRWLRLAEKIVRYFIEKSQKEQLYNVDIIDNK